FGGASGTELNSSLNCICGRQPSASASFNRPWISGTVMQRSQGATNHMLSRFLSVVIIGLFSGQQMTMAEDLNTVLTAAPIDTDSAGKLGDLATHAVIRLLCLERNEVGTGFLHKSGNLITAEHVVRGCNKPQMVAPNGKLADVTVVAADADYD